MPKENIITQIFIFASLLFAILSILIISFILLYQKKRLHHKHELQRMEETFTKEMLSAQIEIQEQTLKHVSSELHDNFNPSLSVVNLNLARALPEIQEPARESVAEAKSIVKQLMSEMKSLSTSLNSDHLINIGFLRALELYVDRIRKSGAYGISFTQNTTWCDISSNKEIILFRMCQEILNNIIKHAEAKKIDIILECRNNFFCIQITDDGIGFDTAKVNAITEDKESTGLPNLRKRADMLEAELIIDSLPGKGTTMIIKNKY